MFHLTAFPPTGGLFNPIRRWQRSHFTCNKFRSMLRKWLSPEQLRCSLKEIDPRRSIDSARPPCRKLQNNIFKCWSIISSRSFPNFALALQTIPLLPRALFVSPDVPCRPTPRLPIPLCRRGRSRHARFGGVLRRWRNRLEISCQAL